MKMIHSLPLLVMALAATPFASASSPSSVLSSTGACSSSESWTYSPLIERDWQQEFESFLSGHASPVRGFSQALALRRLGQSPEERVFAEYWISRALYSANLIHVAYDGFNQIASSPVQDSTAGVQLAALKCINTITEQYTSLRPKESIALRLAGYLAHATKPTDKETLWRFLTQRLLIVLSEERAPKEQANRVIGYLKGSGTYEAFARGVWAAAQADHARTISELKKLQEGSIPDPLKRYSNQIHLLVARAYYSKGNYDQAANQLKQVTKSSNELAKALWELAWAFLSNDRQQEAIGTATNLNVGGMRHTFAPEAPMVMAMALNELCYFPDALRAIESFRRNYEKPYKWLEAWNPNQSLYPLAINYLKKEKRGRSVAAQDEGRIPERVASEWIRSPVFISNQQEINLWLDEKNSGSAMGKAGAHEQRDFAMELKIKAVDLIRRAKKARASIPLTEPLPDSLREELISLKKQFVIFRRIQLAASAWHSVLASHNKKSGVAQAQLIRKINMDLAERNWRMFHQLQEIAENNQLIEVEIYNGASQDIIWQNAHPDYKELAMKFKDEQTKKSAQKVWDWGRTPASDEGGEIWEDELGSFKADLYNNCSSKDKYLAIKRRRS